MPAWLSVTLLRVHAHASLPGDVLPAVGGLWLLWAPALVGTSLALRRPRLLGAVVGLLAVPWAAMALEPHLEAWALYGVLALPVLGYIAGRWPRAEPVLAGCGLLAVLGGAVTPGLEAVGAPDAAPAPGPTVVLITLDTVRADHLGAIGGARFQVPTPHLDALAARGTLFVEGVAPAPLTGPSHTGMLTAASPLDVAVLGNGVRVGTDVPRVAEALAADGWRTGAFVGAAVLDRRIDLDRGFQHYDDRFDRWHRLQGTWPMRALVAVRGVRPRRQRPGREVVERALRWLGPAPGKTLLWVHLYDAHHPYTPEPAFLEAVVDGALDDPAAMGSKADVEGQQAWAKQHLQGRSMPGFGFARDVSDTMRHYAAEIAQVDALVGELLAGLPEDAWIVVAADHGESLTEHGYVMNHGRHAFQATLRVPLIAVGPGFDAGRRVGTPTPSWLVGGTVLQWTGGEGPGLVDAVDGWSAPIESYAMGQEARASFRFGRSGPELAVRQQPFKWIVSPKRAWRFDLEQDPMEQWPEPDPRPDLVERLEALRDGGTAPEADLLEALGYVD